MSVRTVTLAALVLVPVILGGCAGSVASPLNSGSNLKPNASAPLPTGDSAASPSYPDVTTETVEAGILARNDVVDSAVEAGKRLGVELRVPDRLGTRAVERVYVAKPGVLPRLATIQFEDHMQLLVWDLQNADEATRFITSGDSNADLAPYRTTIMVNGFPGRMTDRVQVPPSNDARGNKVAGTGIYTSASRVEWAVGQYVVQFSHKDSKASELLPLTNEILLIPLQP